MGKITAMVLYIRSRSVGFPAVLTAEETAFVETLAVTLYFLSVVNCPTARCTLVASSPVWHCCGSKERFRDDIKS